jgi:hypothetical protein
MVKAEWQKWTIAGLLAVTAPIWLIPFCICLLLFFLAAGIKHDLFDRKRRDSPEVE